MKKQLAVGKRKPLIIMKNSTEKQIFHSLESAERKAADTAILSEMVLAREWLKSEEDRAWDYL